MRISLNDFLSAMSEALDAVEYEFYGARKYHARRVAMLTVGMLEELWWSQVPGGSLVKNGLKARGTMAARIGGAIARAKEAGLLPDDDDETPQGERPEPQGERPERGERLKPDASVFVGLFEEADMPHLVDLRELIKPEGTCLSGEAWADIDAHSLLALFGAAALHDSGLSKYYRELGKQKPNSLAAEPVEFLRSHCEEGERIISIAPFYDEAGPVYHAVLYHHENADGSGPFGLTATETPLFARLIHLADTLDVRFSFDDMTPEKYLKVIEFVRKQTGRLFDEEVADAFLCAFPLPRLASLAGDQLMPQLKAVLPDVFVDYGVGQLSELGGVFAQITDYKSTFTSKHSQGVATRAYQLAKYEMDRKETYGKIYEGMGEDLCDDLCGRIYLAGALHDIGKLFVPTDILEKPGRLTPEEFEKMKDHAQKSWKVIGDIRGMGKIQHWAALHHEKLDGAGYPKGLTGDQLDHVDRMMAIADIYQALTEYRPYRTANTHEEAIEMMRKMAALGKIDAELVEEAAVCYADGDAEAE